MRNIKSYILFIFISIALGVNSKSIITLENGWKFSKGEFPEAFKTDFDDKSWQKVKVPHDWAIYGPFDKNIDKQVVAIVQNGETIPTEKTGRTGALPYVGVGWYRTQFEIPEFVNGKKVIILFDGAMSRAEVYINEKKVGNWGYGYNSFYFDITDFINKNGKNLLAVRLVNLEESSRWYPGAGLYRNVHLIVSENTSISTWGTYITTPFVSNHSARVNIQTKIENPVKGLKLTTTVKDAKGKVVGVVSSDNYSGGFFDQQITIDNPYLWSPETPVQYFAHSELKIGDNIIDTYLTKFGIRSISFTPDKGFQLNGITRKFKGVCLHHDLGPLGAAVNVSAIKRQLTILKDMGCDAIRTAHNMPATELLDLCDEMGFMVIDEAFDEWKQPKCKNGYNKFFDEWAEKDLINFVRRDRNHPSIVMWSIGNEVPEQSYKNGSKVAYFLREIIKKEDNTRPVTAGMDRVDNAIQNQFASTLDVPGLNYRLPKYQIAYDLLPQGFILGSETASTISSRGIYKFPVKPGKDIRYPDLQCSSYDLEACNWSNIPDDDWMWQDDKDWVIGEFVWTGFDYLGEPTPYDDYWPSRSSYFGICDLAGLPKDRYYLYRSRWNKKENTLHILPHWNWKGREGEITPVYVYTNYNEAELFLNGKSQGRIKKGDKGTERYRLMWNNVKYESGTIKVIAYENGKPVAEKTLVSSGKPANIKLEADRNEIKADGKELSFITVSLTDKNGNPCADATNELAFKVSGAGYFKAACSGDPTSVEQFHLPKMKLFSGKLVVLVQSDEKPGNIILEVSGKGLKTSKITIKSLN